MARAQQQLEAELLTPEFSALLDSTLAAFGTDIYRIFKTERDRRQAALRAARKSAFCFALLSRTRETTWKVTPPAPSPCVWPVVDIGDVDPCNLSRLEEAFASEATGVQVDFDDGFAPTWDNVLVGHRNVKQLIVERLSPTCPKMKFRLRAWNMIEPNIVARGVSVPGPIVDTLLHLVHNGHRLYALDGYILMYLPKLETGEEAELWDRLLTWAEQHLELPIGTVRVCVLIETLPAVFEAEDILHAFRRRSAGLNCGIWDYAASLITRLGQADPTSCFPDRTQYVSMASPFLATYRHILADICLRREAPLTGGMFAGIVQSAERASEVEAEAVDARLSDVAAGCSGGLVYDVRLVLPVLRAVEQRPVPKTLPPLPINCSATLLSYETEKPPTLSGFCSNVEVIARFVTSWLDGKGQYELNGRIEDSATAEISRAQVWQQLHFQKELYPSGKVAEATWRRIMQEHKGVRVVASEALLGDVLGELMGVPEEAKCLTRELLTLPECPVYVTSWLLQKGVLQRSNLKQRSAERHRGEARLN